MYYSNGSVWTLLGSDAPGWGSFTENYGDLDNDDGSGGTITHTPSSTGAAGSGTPMATSTLVVTDEAEAIHEFASTGVTVSDCTHVPAHTGSKTLVEAGVTIGATSGEITITPPQAWESDSVIMPVVATDGINIINKNIQWAVKSNEPIDPYWDDVTLLITGAETISGSTFTTSDSIGHTGTLSGTAEQVNDGKWDKGFRIGVSSAAIGRIYIPNHADFNGMTSGTIESWVRYNSSDRHTIISNSNEAEGYSATMWIMENGGSMNYIYWWADTYLSGTMPTGVTPGTGVWNHFAWVWGSGFQRAYMNGRLVASNTSTVTLGTSAYGLIVGNAYNSNGGLYLKGTLSGVRITKDTVRYSGTSTDEWGNFDEPNQRWGVVSS